MVQFSPSPSRGCFALTWHICWSGDVHVALQSVHKHLKQLASSLGFRPTHRCAYLQGCVCAYLQGVCIPTGVCVYIPKGSVYTYRGCAYLQGCACLQGVCIPTGVCISTEMHGPLGMDIHVYGNHSEDSGCL